MSPDDRRVTEHRPRTRFARRDGDTRWQKAAALFLRYRGAVSWLTGGALGSVGTMLLMRFFLVTQLDAQDKNHNARMDGLGASVNALSARVAPMESAMITLVNDVCYRYTQAEQTVRQMHCPVTIYKGAP